MTRPEDPPPEAFDERPVRSFWPFPDAEIDFSRWPAAVPAVGQILREGLDLAGGLTVLVGENGSGKSSVVEMLAEAYGLNPKGGSAQGRLFQTRDAAPGVGSCLQVVRSVTRTRWAYFLRADTMHTLYDYLADNPGRRDERYHELSHGEGFLAMLRSRVSQPGFYLMDEPDTPLSFVACLGLAALLHDLAATGSQAIVATHSPIIAAVPGATILEVGEWGLRPARWADLDLVVSWRRFLTEPDSYFRRMLGD